MCVCFFIRHAAKQKATSHSQSVTGAYLQFAGSLVITVDLQKVVDIYLHLWHFLLLKSRVLVSDLVTETSAVR